MADAILQAPMARTEFTPGMRIVLEAINPTTGATVAGVVLSAIALEADDPGVGASGGGALALQDLSWYPVPLTA